jgi:hypothetical protein
MALVQYGSGVAYMSGRIAGTVHARNKGGSYVRRFSVPVNPSTGFQQTVRASLAAASAAWQALDPGVQQAWKAWAETHPVVNRLGASSLLTGHQAYVSCQRNAASAGELASLYENPPLPPAYEFPFDADFTIAASGTAGTMTIAPDHDPAASSVQLVYASPPVSPGRTHVSELMKFLGHYTVAHTGGAPPAVDIATEYEARFGDLTVSLVGKKVVVAVRTYSYAQLSGITAASTLFV